jgi:hypothetical protein
MTPTDMTPSDDPADPPSTGDAGMMAGDSAQDPMSEPEPVVLPMDGTQFAVCENDRDCDMGLGCYGAGAATGYCSAECEGDEDCAALGANFGCGQSGLCAAECEGEQDSACPAHMRCTPVGEDTFRCQYPPELTEEPPVPFGGCENDMDCGELECLGSAMGGSGFCSRACTPEEPGCEDLMPASGSIQPTCVPQNPQLGRCALDCEAAPDGCPEGLSCQQQGFYRLCLP